MAGDQAQFYQLLNTILSIDNEIRSQAEKVYNDIPTETKVVHLVGAVQNADLGEECRETAAVLLRRLLSAEFFEFFPKLPFDQQAMLREQLLLTLQMDSSQQLRRKICDVVSELARNHIDDDGVNQWPEFIQFMFNCASAQDPNIKEAGIRMFTSVPGVFGNRQNENLDVIKRMLLTALQPTESEVLRMQAVKAVGAFILLHDKEPAIQKHFSDLLLPFMQVVVQSIEKADDDAALKVLIELAESAPKFLRPQVETIFQVCIKVIGDKDGEDNWRQLALETLVTLCETAPAMVRKVVPNAIRMLTPLVLDMLCELDEEPDWAVQDNAANEDNELNYVAAESALDRMCCGLGGKIMLSLIVGQVPEMLNSQDWKRRHAALMAVSSAGEGCHKQMEQMLDQVVSAVLNYLTDPHPRVRYAACNAIGQMSTDFAPVFEKKFHDKVVPGLLMVLEDNAHPRVQAHAAAALVNFSEDCPKSILTQYLGPLMGKIEAILNLKFKELVESGNKLVLEQIVTTIASVADTVEKDFVAYYDRLMPCLKYIIANATTDEFKMLRGKTIECVSLIGLAVGEEKFMADASEVMDMLLKTHTEGDQLPADDPQTSYLISAWSRICKIMGKKFAQYLPMVMEPVMRTAAMKPEVALLDNDDLEVIEGDLDWHFVTLGEQQNFGIKTAGLEDKASACDMLVCYARELKEAFVEYAEDVVKLMVQMLQFYFHDNVRTAAAESLPYLLECAQIRGPQYIQGMWAFILPDLLKAIDSEPDQDVQVELLNSLAKCIELLGAGCLGDESMAEVLRILNKLLTEHFERATERRQKRTDEDYDEVVEEQLVDEDNEDVYGLSRVADVLHALMSAYHENFFPHLDSLLPHLVQLLGPGRPYADRQWAICIFDDVIEFGGPACVKYQDIFLEPMLNGLREPEPEVRQAAAYGCGVLAQFGGQHFAAACARAVPLLAALIAEPTSRAVENLNATENAISAVTKIIKYNHSQINRDEIIRHWLTWLPVVEDTEEAPHVYSLLCELAASGHAALATPDAPQRVIATLAEAFLRDAVPDDNPVFAQMVSLVRQIQVVEEQLVDEDNEDVYGLSRVADVLHALMSAYHENFFPHLDSLLPHLVQLLGPGRPYADRQWAICIFDDVIEFGGPACVKYQDIFLEPMLNGLREPEPEVRQAAAYGCGVLAQFGGQHFAAACARAVPLLAALIAEPTSRAVENLNATENAISAVTKIIKYNHSQINRDEIIRHWLTWLPVVEDTEEAPHVYSLLCELAASGHAALATPDAPQRVIATLAEAFLRDAVPDDNPVFAQMVSLVRQIQSNAELFNSCLMQLSNDHKEALKQALLATPVP